MHTLFHAIRQDIRYAIRGLLRSPGFTLVAALTLALGIGANTAIFSVLYGVLLRPLAFPEPERLVQLSQTYQQYRGEMAITYRQWRFLEDNAGWFASQAATTSVGLNLFTGAQADRVNGLRVSKDYFRVLGVEPALGRTFTADEDAEGGPGALILSHQLWASRFGGDSAVAGRSVSVDGQPYTVVGVMPASYATGADAWSTLAQVGRTIGSGQNLQFVARLKPGLTLASAQAGFQQTAAAFREAFSGQLSREVGIELAPMRDLMVQDVRTPVRILFGAIAFVLLIACANVANLVLGRTATRGRELAVRVALGASRGRIVRLLLTESVVLALVGGALGLFLADWVLGALLALAPSSLTGAGDIRLDRWALAFTAGVSVLTGLLFGLAPAWRAARDLSGALKEGSGRTGSSVSQGRLRGALVVGEVALSLVLLVGAGLLVETVRNLVRTNPGFETRNLLAAEIWLTGTGRDSTAAITALYGEVTRRLEAMPGVSSAAVVEAGLPLQRGGNMPFSVDGRVIQAATEYRTATPGYLELLRVPLVEGRLLASGDVAGAEPVAVVSRAFARQFLADSSPLGHTVQLGRSDPPRRIVGMVGDLKSFIGRDAGPAVFITSAQTPAGFTRIFSSWFPTHVVVRTAGDPRALRDALARAIRDADARVPVGRVRTMEEVLDGSLAFQRFLMLLLSVFAGLAVALAAVGVYGLMSHAVAQRTHEIGVRMALGALQRDVLGLIVSRGLLMAGIGVVIGLFGAAALTRLLGGMLYGVRPVDPRTFASVAALLMLVALAACYLPARRAARVDPMVALRAE